MIVQRIDAAVLSHGVEFGKHPLKIYLGVDEYAELRAVAKTVCVRMMERGVSGRANYRGMDIYSVDDVSYLAVGM